MGNNMRILYAEDNELDAELTKIILEEHEFTVDIVTKGDEAWDAYNRQKPDILLLDLNLPQKDGIEVTRLIRQKDPHTHIIIYTSHGEPEREIAALDAGADEFIPKDRPFENLAPENDRTLKRTTRVRTLPHHNVQRYRTHVNHPRRNHPARLRRSTSFTIIMRQKQSSCLHGLPHEGNMGRRLLRQKTKVEGIREPDQKTIKKGSIHPD